jgi:uncharacterized membrane protein
MLKVAKSSVVTKLEAAAEIAAASISLSGAVTAFVFAKFVIAVVLAVVGIGIGLRFVARRKTEPKAIPTPTWVRFSCGLLATVEVGVLVEATDLPVRFSQPGFQLHHWLVVLLAWLVAYLLQASALRSFVSKRHATKAL